MQLVTRIRTHFETFGGCSSDDGVEHSFCISIFSTKKMIQQRRRLLVLASCVSIALGWSSVSPVARGSRSITRVTSSTVLMTKSADDDIPSTSTRRSFVSSVAMGTILAPACAAQAEDEDFGSIAARAAKISQEIRAEEERNPAPKANTNSDKRTAYDFSVPVKGEAIPFKDFIGQEFVEQPVGEGEDPKPPNARVKAILVVNIKQDDIVARKNIPELISLAAAYGRSGDLAVVVSPSDQGYYEPDTSQLIRLKLASEYGYGINPSTKVTDKVNLLGSGAHPFWRWLEGNCRTPAGLGKITQNFEKFLIDGRTGKPLRRYPRKYQPLDIKNDIETVIAGKPLGPAGANYNEEWRQAAIDSERDTYRFQKGLNYFDQ